LGPNGAGKTTLLRCILKLIKPSRGTISFKGRVLSSRDILENFGFLPENFQPPATLTAGELLKILSWGLNLKASQIDACLEQVGLKEQKNKFIGAYSRGMVQRLGLAIALLKQPQVVILDEPTLGLDPIGQSQILRLIVNLNKQGKTIFFSSHILSQIEKVAGRVGIIHQGKLRFVGSVKQIMDKHHSSSLEEAFLKEVCPAAAENAL
jgi:ABC-type multidrug transport system ATPase subunit